MTTRAGSLVHVWVESGRERAQRIQTDSADNFKQFFNGCRPQGVNIISKIIYEK